MSRAKRITSKTGALKETKGVAWHLLPWDALRALTFVYAAGAKKYAPNNWRKGYPWSLSHDSLLNHLSAFWHDGEENDEELGTHHMLSVAWHALTLWVFTQIHPEFDDRLTTNASADPLRNKRKGRD